MYRLRAGISIFIVLLTFSGKVFSQEPLDVKLQFGKRAAMIPQSPSDTGIIYDEGRMEEARREYMYNLRTSGGEKDIRKIETDAYNAMRKMENTAAFKVQSSSAWQQIGGSQDGHSSGRIRAIAFDPTNSKIVYVGAASGGLWKTMDIDQKPIQWINLSDRLPTVNFGALAVDPKRPNIIFAGTGESQGDNYQEPPGSGLFKSTDGGLNWAVNSAAIGSVCSQIVIDPQNTDLIYVASDDGSGILKSSDGGTTWKKISVGVSPLCIAIDPVTPSKLYVSGFSKIYRSIDNGETWVQAKTGLPTSNTGRVTIAVAPSSPNTIYASYGNSSTRGFLGVWASNDFGVTWSQINTGTANLIGTQQEWCNSLVVHPTSSKRIFIGGLDIYQSNDSGKNATQLSHWTDPVTSTSYVHADIHLLAFNGATNSATLYACTDGGIAKTTSPFNAWSTDINLGLATLQFVGVDADKPFTYATGGCQDNGTNRATIAAPEFHETHGGDGGKAWVSPDDPLIAYTTYVYTTFFRSLDGAKTFGENMITAQNNPALYNIFDGKNPGGEGARFYPNYDVSSDGTVIAFGALRHVWISTSGGVDGFTAVNPPTVAISDANAIHVSQNDASLIWAGTGGTVFRSTDQGITWAKTAIASAGAITDIKSNPKNPLEVFVATSGGKHFYKSSDGGVTFSSPVTNLSANLPGYSIAFSQKDGKLFMGSEKGVIWSQDGGSTWYPLMNGLPLVLVNTLKIKGTDDNILLAGTYGRGMFWVDISTLGVRSESNTNSQISLDPLYPNPMTNENATVGFTLKDGGVATITVHDQLGRELRTVEKSYFDAGHHQASFVPAGISKGTYFVMLTANGKSVSQKVVID